MKGKANTLNSVIPVSMRIKICVFLLIVFPSALHAAYSWTPNCTKAYEAMLRLNFKETARLLNQERALHPDNSVPVYIEGYADFLKTFISEENTDFEKLKLRNELRIDTLKATGEDPYKRVCIAELYLELSIIKIKFDEYFGAAYEVRKAYHSLEENQQLYPSFLPNLRTAGFMHAVIGSVPHSFQWVTNMLGMKGTINQGLGELNQLLTASYKQPQLAYLTDETVVLLTFLEMNLSKNKSDEKIRLRLASVNQPERKPLILFTASVFHFANGENDSVIDLLQNRKTDPEAYQMNYLDFMEGNAKLHNLDFSAEESFTKYLNNYKGRSYVLASWQRVAWIKLLTGNLKGYQDAIQHCLLPKYSKPEMDEDKQALADAKAGTLPNLNLLRCRLLFDGGYYQRSLAELAGKPMSQFPSQKDKIEFTYRLARIFDKTDKKDQAEHFYKETLKNGAAFPWYFASNSALLLGQLYEDKGNKKMALEYYNKTLDMHNHEYQNSIDQKAKAGINRLTD